ncbi:MAG: aminotransferase class IV [Verrucomicrobiae bacterium]|nr:aminotransferase class IV [Verrucomicrobiae bacterium]
MATSVVFLDRRFVPENRAAISVFDRGLLYGDGLFETVRIYQGRFFRLAAHIRRLFDGLKTLGIKIPLTRAEMEIYTREVALSNRIREGFARLVVTRGEGYLGFSPRGAGPSRIAICARERPVAVRRRSVWKLRWHPQPVAPLPLKSLSSLPHVIAKLEAERAGFDEALLFDARGRLIEATASNVFLLKGGGLVTPPLSSGCLPGITRAELIKLARREGWRVAEKEVRAEDCRRADGIFLTNSLLEIVPCTLGKKPDLSVTAAFDELEALYAYHRTVQSR